MCEEIHFEVSTYFEKPKIIHQVMAKQLDIDATIQIKIIIKNE
jgi:hypothetical protein